MKDSVIYPEISNCFILLNKPNIVIMKYNFIDPNPEAVMIFNELYILDKFEFTNGKLICKFEDNLEMVISRINDKIWLSVSNQIINRCYIISPDIFIHRDIPIPVDMPCTLAIYNFVTATRISVNKSKNCCIIQ